MQSKITDLRIVSVGRDRGPIIWIAEGDSQPRPVRLSDAQAFHLIGQLVRATEFLGEES